MVIHIEIGKMHVAHRFRVRIGDCEGAVECSNINKEEVMTEIRNALDELDDGHDTGCERSMCYCANRLRKSEPTEASP